MTTLINKESISSAKIYRKSICAYYGYKKEVRLLGFLIKKAGIYFDVTIHPYIVSEKDVFDHSNGSCYVQDNTVYYYPHIDFRMNSGNTYTKYFKDENELNKFVDELSNEIDFIQITN